MQIMRMSAYGLVVAAGLLLTPAVATSGPAAQPAGLAQAGALPLVQDVHWRSYRHCHGPRWNRRCHGARKHWRSGPRGWHPRGWKNDRRWDRDHRRNRRHRS